MTVKAPGGSPAAGTPHGPPLDRNGRSSVEPDGRNDELSLDGHRSRPVALGDSPCPLPAELRRRLREKLALSLATISWATVVSSLLVIASLLPIVQLPIWAVVSAHGANLFFVALLVHRRPAIERPPAERLTQFYLLLSLGGVCGGAFSASSPRRSSRPLPNTPSRSSSRCLRPGPRRPGPGKGFLRRNADLLLPFAFAAILGAAKAMPTGGSAGPVLLGALLLSGVAALALSRRALFASPLAWGSTPDRDLPPTSLHPSARSSAS